MIQRIGQDIQRRRPTVKRLLDPRQPIVVRRVPKPAEVPVAAPASTPTPLATPPPTPAAPAPARLSVTWRQLVGGSAKAGLALGLIIICFVMRIGLAEQLIAAYAIVALLYRFDSQRSFLVALIFLVMVAGWSAVGQTSRAEIFAVYAFYFLIIGLIAALREVRRQPQEVQSV